MKYTFTNFELSEDYQQRVRDYIAKGLGNQSIISVDGLFFDLKSLSIPINLDCLHCEEVCDINCCDGHPYPPQKECIDYALENIEEIFQDYNVGDLDARMKAYNILKEKGSLTVNMGNRQFTPGAIKKTKPMQTFPYTKADGCIFNILCNGQHKCALHANCLTKGIDPFTKKPIHCSTYPLCSIDISEDSKFIFCVLDPDITFGLWTNIDFLSRPCSNKNMFTDPNRTIFKDEDYKPAFIQCYHSLTYFINEDILKQVIPYFK